MVNLVSYGPKTKEVLHRVYGKGMEFNRVANKIVDAMLYPPALPLKDMEHRSFTLTTNEGITLSCDARRIDRFIRIKADIPDKVNNL